MLENGGPIPNSTWQNFSKTATPIMVVEKSVPSSIIYGWKFESAIFKTGKIRIRWWFELFYPGHLDQCFEKYGYASSRYGYAKIGVSRIWIRNIVDQRIRAYPSFTKNILLLKEFLTFVLHLFTKHFFHIP